MLQTAPYFLLLRLVRCIRYTEVPFTTSKMGNSRIPTKSFPRKFSKNVSRLFPCCRKRVSEVLRWGKRKVLKLSAELISSGDWFKIWLFPYRGYSLGHRWSLGEVYYLKWISKCTKKIIPKIILTFCARLHKIAWNSRNYSRKPFQCFRKMIQICNDSRIPPQKIFRKISLKLYRFITHWWLLRKLLEILEIIHKSHSTVSTKWCNLQ